MDHQHILSWADRHLECLEATFDAYWKEHPNTLVTEYDHVTGEQAVSYVPQRVAPDKEEWIFQIGDAIHNMRVSLDYLAFRIVENNPPMSTKITKVAFPICYDPSKFSELVGRRLGKCIRSDIKDAFESLQPYPTPNVLNLHSLAMLDNLENVHKHRRLLSAYPAITSLSQVGESEKIRVTSLYNPNGLPLDKRTELYRYVILDPSHSEDDVQFKMRRYVCFREPEFMGPGGIIVMRALKLIRDEIRNVIFPKLEPFL